MSLVFPVRATGLPAVVVARVLGGVVSRLLWVSGERG